MARILIVDDNRSVRQTLEFLLKDDGHEVALCDSGPAALALAVAQSFDLILLDVDMPVMSGLTVLAALKKDERTSGVPVVMVTACATRELVRRASAAGAAFVMSKPFNVEDLKAEVRRRLPGGGCSLAA